MADCSPRRLIYADAATIHELALKSSLLLISLTAISVPFIESAHSQTAPPIKKQSIFAPYQPEPKFAPARGLPAQPNNGIGEQTGNQNGDFQENSNANQSGNQSGNQNNSGNNQEPFTVTPDGTPALNIVPAVDRPPIPPPPDAAPLRPNGNGIARPAQAWRVKAFQLFKQKLDPNTTIALLLNAEYNNAMAALQQAIEEEGLFVTTVSSSSGHMLISSTASNNGTNINNADSQPIRSEKVIVAMRPALIDSKSKADAKTEMRVLCESRNKSLTVGRMKEILSKLQTKFGDIKTNAETL